MTDYEKCPGYQILTEKFEMAQKHMDDRFDALLKHSDERDDIIEEKIEKLDKTVSDLNYFMRNGFTDRVLKTITSYFDEKIAKGVKIFVSTAVIAAIGYGIKLLFF